MKRSRKGSMQMSIEAIIILVIAMVLLGLALVFVKGLFAKGTESLGGRFDVLKEYCDVSRDNPILPKIYTLKADQKNEQADICVYNNLPNKIVDGNIRVTECLQPDGSPIKAKFNADGTVVVDDGSGEQFPIIINSLSENFDRNQAIGFKTGVNTEEALVGVYRCKVEILGDDPGKTPGPSGTDNDVKIGPVQVQFNME